MCSFAALQHESRPSNSRSLHFYVLALRARNNSVRIVLVRFFRCKRVSIMISHYSPIRRIQTILFAGLFACMIVACPSAANAQGRGSVAGGAIAGAFAGAIAGAIIANQAAQEQAARNKAHRQPRVSRSNSGKRSPSAASGQARSTADPFAGVEPAATTNVNSR
jgi:hypothetical protein